ncbi:epoxide hydrolase family protein [Pseudaminobacter soli (ex Li et al. 2025)]|uniref:Multidrug MFS transporter n=1 Tax=Pseudaminobacter soli (ex Li et al. 2025) TaxID=1295366 RepID=A0A2P7RU63_9HYPH|nr:epoxide hydrolase family protein [Mesorhizobium soli]PSJ53760.1 multidrug MFS transporter [Mesorhizobium soli]
MDTSKTPVTSGSGRDGIDRDRRRLLVGAATGLMAVGAAGMWPASPTYAAPEDAIRPFRVNVPDEDILDLRRRLAATRWPEKETVADDSQGVPLAMMQDLVRHWQTDYDWRKVEARLNALPQFITEIDGLDIHFIHVRSQHGNALPMIVTHGWPGSVIEQMKIIDPLTNPTANGGSADDAFHLVIPSMPGYGFSGKPSTTGWDPQRIARAWVVLMKRLGYEKFVAQGGDWGSPVSHEMAKLGAPELLGIHVNLPGVVPPEVFKAIASGDAPPANLSVEEKQAFDQLKLQFTKRRAYAQIMGTRPQTLSALTDSPAGLATWLLDHGDGYAQPASAMQSAVLGRAVNGHSSGALTRDDVLDNISLYWLTNTAISSARLYWENKTNLYLPANVSIPAAVTAFPGESYVAPRSWAEKAYHNLIYFHQAEAGGHFAAWEQPVIFSREVRDAFRPLRS